MKHRDIFSIIESVYPVTLAEKWDKVALQVGDYYAKTTGVLLALDLSMEVIEQAIELGHNLIITHHPIDLKLPFPLDIAQPTGQLIAALIQNHLTHYAAHTNFDSGNPSVSDMMLQKLGFNETSVPLFPNRNHPETGLGKGITLSQPITAERLFKRVQKAFHLDQIRYIAPKKSVSKIAVLGGSGGSLIKNIADQGYDCYITGDVKYHDARFSEAVGLFTIDAGHFNTEVVALELIQQLLEKRDLDIEITITERERDPFAYMEVIP